MKLVSSVGSPTMMARKPKTSATGSPTEKMLSVGAARLTTPNARLAMSRAVTAGSDTASAPEKSCEPHVTTDQKPAGPRPVVPMGSVWKPSISVLMSARCPLSTRKISVTRMV